MGVKYIFGVGVTLLIVAISGIEAQNGAPCHASIFDFTPRHTLNISGYMGKWYVHEVAGSHIGNFPPPVYKCYTIDLSLPNPDDVLNIEGVDNFINLSDGEAIQFRNTFAVNDTRSPMSSMWTLTDEEGTTAKVIIMSADLEFQAWTVIYSCSHQGPDNYRYEILMAMTRTPNIPPELRQFLKALMVGQGFRIGDHHSVNQTEC